MRDVHVVPHYDSWTVKRDGGVRVSRLANSQEEAIEIGERLAKRDKVRLVIHDTEAMFRIAELRRCIFGSCRHGIAALPRS
jgi:hypothetical protein